MPAVGLLLLAPLVGEYLLGNVSIVEIGALPVLALLYGGGAVLILLSFVVGHAVWSIAVPIAMVEALVPGRRTTPWLGRADLAVAGALYLLGAVLVFRYMQQDSGGSPRRPSSPPWPWCPPP